MAALPITPWMGASHGIQARKDGQPRNSRWVIEPYFFLVWIIHSIHVLVWPWLIMEELCEEKFDMAWRRQADTVLNCLYHDWQQTNTTNATWLHQQQARQSEMFKSSINWVAVGQLLSSFMSPMFFGCLWHHVVVRWNGKFATLVPPFVFFIQAGILVNITTSSSPNVKYYILAAALLTAIYGDFQGLFYLYYHVKHASKTENLYMIGEVLPIKLHFVHGFLYLAIAVAGFLFLIAFDSTYSMIFVCTFMGSLVCLMYGLIMDNGEKRNVGESKEKADNDTTDASASFSDTDEDIELLQSALRSDKQSGLTAMITDVPIIFTERPYEKELVLILTAVIFTIAASSDYKFSAALLYHAPFHFTYHQYGFCVLLQGLVKFATHVALTFLTRTIVIRHGVVACFAAISYIAYYIVLGVASSPLHIYIASLVNVAGGCAFPAMFSFIKFNIDSMKDTVVLLAFVSSYLASILSTAASTGLYMNLYELFPGSLHLMWAGGIAAGCVIAVATYLSASGGSHRRSQRRYKALMHGEG